MNYFIKIEHLSEVLKKYALKESEMLPFFNQKLKISTSLYFNLCNNKEIFLIPDIDKNIEIEDFNKLFTTSVSLEFKEIKNNAHESIVCMTLLDFGCEWENPI